MSDDDTPIDPYPPGVSEYFGVGEFACHDDAHTPYPSEWIASRWTRLAATCDIIRDQWDGPLRVVSGYRTPEHNAAIGGAKLSFHMEGMAADLRPLGYDGADLEAAVDQLHTLVLSLWNAGKLTELGGLGNYPASGWIHVDTRNRVPIGHLAQWSGHGFGSEQVSA